MIVYNRWVGVDRGVTILAHRGYHAAGLPENSAAALAAANAVADGVEFDVRETKEGELILNHNADALGHSIANAKFRTLRDASEREGRTIATLEEAVDAVEPGKFVFAEVKVGGIAPRVVAACLLRFGERFRIGSFRFSDIAKAPRKFRWLIVNHPSELALYRDRVHGVACRADTFSFPHPSGLELAAWVVTPERTGAILRNGARFLIVDDPEKVRAALA